MISQCCFNVLFCYILVDCPAGTSAVITDSAVVCRLCDQGSYNNERGQSECVPCPVHKSTLKNGALSIDECKGNFIWLVLHFKKNQININL